MEDSEYINWGDKQHANLQSSHQPLTHSSSGFTQQSGHQYYDTNDNDFNGTSAANHGSYNVNEPQNQRDYSQQMYAMSYTNGQPSPSMSPPIMNTSTYMMPQQRSTSHESFNGMSNDSINHEYSQQAYQIQSQGGSQSQQQPVANHAQSQQRMHDMPNPYQYANSALYRGYPQTAYNGYAPYGAQVQGQPLPRGTIPGYAIAPASTQMGQYGYQGQTLANGYNPYPRPEDATQYYQSANMANMQAVNNQSTVPSQSVAKSSKATISSNPVRPSVSPYIAPSRLTL